MTSLSPQDQAVEIQDHHEESHPDHRMFGLATFLVADAMTFAGFFAAYLTFKAVNPLLPGAVYELELPLPTLNTILLLVVVPRSIALVSICAEVTCNAAGAGYF